MSKTSKVFLISTLLLLIGVIAFLSCNTAKDAIAKFFSIPAPIYTYTIVNSWPHDPASFTEVLIYKNDTLYESSGRNESSILRIVYLTTGAVKTKVDLADQYFAEGIDLLNGKIF